MNIAKLKSKNQITIPMVIVKKMHLRPSEMFVIDTENSRITLTPVEIEPRYTSDELDAIDGIVENGKKTAKPVAPGKAFSAYIKKITK